MTPYHLFTTGEVENPSNPGGNGDDVYPIDGWNTAYTGIVGTYARSSAEYAVADNSNEPVVVKVTAACFNGTAGSYDGSYNTSEGSPAFTEGEAWGVVASGLTAGAFYITGQIDQHASASYANYPWDEGVFGGYDFALGKFVLFYQGFSQDRSDFYAEAEGSNPSWLGLYFYPGPNGDGTYTVDLYTSPDGSQPPILTIDYQKNDISPFGDAGVEGYFGIASEGQVGDTGTGGTKLFTQFGGGSVVGGPTVLDRITIAGQAVKAAALR